MNPCFDGATTLSHARTDQPLPSPSPQSQPVLPALLAVVEQGLMGEVREWIKGALVERTEVGTERYGQPLHTHNGRDARTDAEQEALDLLQYLQQMIMERRSAGGDVRRLVLARTWTLAALAELGQDDRLLGGVAQEVTLGRFGVRVEPAALREDASPLEAFGRSEAGGAP